MQIAHNFQLRNPHGPGGVYFAWQRTSGGYLATTGYDQVMLLLKMAMAMAMTMNCVVQVIHIYNRHADLVEQLRLPGMCSCFGWDKVNTWLVDDGNNISGMV